MPSSPLPVPLARFASRRCHRSLSSPPLRPPPSPPPSHGLRKSPSTAVVVSPRLLTTAEQLADGEGARRVVDRPRSLWQSWRRFNAPSYPRRTVMMQGIKQKGCVVSSLIYRDGRAT